MMRSTIHDKLTVCLGSDLRRSVNVIVSIMLLAAAIDALLVTYQLGYKTAEWNHFAQMFGQDHHDRTFIFIQIRIAVAFIVSTIGLLLRRSAGFFISTAALMWIGYEYAWWYLESRQRLIGLGTNGFSQEQVSNLQYAYVFLGASSWDIVLLVVATLVFGWQVLIFINLLKSTRAKTSGPCIK